MSSLSARPSRAAVEDLFRSPRGRLEIRPCRALSVPKDRVEPGVRGPESPFGAGTAGSPSGRTGAPGGDGSPTGPGRASSKEATGAGGGAGIRSGRPGSTFGSARPAADGAAGTERSTTFTSPACGTAGTGAGAGTGVAVGASRALRRCVLRPGETSARGATRPPGGRRPPPPLPARRAPAASAAGTWRSSARSSASDLRAAARSASRFGVASKTVGDDGSTRAQGAVARTPTW